MDFYTDVGGLVFAASAFGFTGCCAELACLAAWDRTLERKKKIIKTFLIGGACILSGFLGVAVGAFLGDWP
jgi:hypothetical protein